MSLSFFTFLIPPPPLSRSSNNGCFSIGFFQIHGTEKEEKEWQESNTNKITLNSLKVSHQIPLDS
jgi:hypothetical protein